MKLSHYIDFKAMPSKVRGDYAVLPTLFGKLHIYLAKTGATNIGVSFPAHDEENFKIGNILRLHGSQEVLAKSQELQWFKGMSDCVEVGSIAQVPEVPEAKHRAVTRKRFKTSADRMRRRLVNRGLATEEEACERISDIDRTVKPYPYLLVASDTNKQRFFMYIDHQEIVDAPTDGPFNAYGMGAGATIPWF